MAGGQGLTIGAVAGRTGCTVPTIRYYEDIGLLPRAARTAAGRRSYGEADLRRLLFIRRSRDSGFAIEKVRELVSLFEAGTQDCTQARDLAQSQLVQVQLKIQELKALESSLTALVTECDARCSGGMAADCTLLADLNADTPRSCCG